MEQTSTIESFEPNLSAERSSQLSLTSCFFKTIQHIHPKSPTRTGVEPPGSDRRTNKQKHLPGRMKCQIPVTETFPMRPKEELFNKPADTTNSPIIFALLERAMSSVGGFAYAVIMPVSAENVQRGCVSKLETCFRGNLLVCR